MPPPKPKTLSRQALQGQKGVNVLEEVVLEMGSRWSASGPNEVGIDGYIELFDPRTGHALGTTVAVQSKAVATFDKETPETFELTCSARDVDYWMQGNLPVILVVSRPTSREAFWVSIKDYFADPTRRAASKVTFTKSTQRFTKDTLNSLLTIGRPRDLGLYLAPLPREETLFSNLLELESSPQRIYFAQTSHRSPREVLAALRAAAPTRIAGEWILREKAIMAFFDLAQPPWPAVCDEGTVESFSTAEWSDSEDPARRRQFVQLLGRSLREQLYPVGVRYWPEEDCYAFSGTTDRQHTYQALQRRSRMTVIRRFERTTDEGRTFTRFRHLAFRARFRRISEKWYIEITPTYRFTWNGTDSDRFHAEWLSGIKRIEGNRAVLSQVLIWADLLARPELSSGPKPTLAFKLPLSFKAPVGIDDGGWSARDPAPPQGDSGEDESLSLPFPTTDASE